MYHLIYLSSASQNISEDELIEILIDSRKRNEANKITGMLIYSEGSIVQLIEGDEHEVIRLFNKISEDNRHKDIIKILEGPIAERSFNDWAMGFKATSFKEIENYSGYKNINKNTFTATIENSQEHPAFQILRSFYQNYKKG